MSTPNEGIGKKATTPVRGINIDAPGSADYGWEA
jgi:hypothetical protein